MKKFATLIATAACLTGLAAIPAQAEDLRVQVGYADLDIGSDAGAAALAALIDAKAGQACARSGDMRSVTLTATCKEHFVASAAEQLNAKGHALVAGKLAARG